MCHRVEVLPAWTLRGHLSGFKFPGGGVWVMVRQGRGVPSVEGNQGAPGWSQRSGRCVSAPWGGIFPGTRDWTVLLVEAREPQ